jgi:hypothetical protein
MDLDPDVCHTNPGYVRIHESQPWWSYYSLQAYYWIPLYSQLVISRRVGEWYSMFIDRRFKSITINPLPAVEYFWAGAAFVSTFLRSNSKTTTLTSHR